MSEEDPRNIKEEREEEEFRTAMKTYMEVGIGPSFIPGHSVNGLTLCEVRVISPRRKPTKDKTNKEKDENICK